MTTDYSGQTVSKDRIEEEEGEAKDVVLEIKPKLETDDERIGVPKTFATFDQDRNNDVVARAIEKMMNYCCLSLEHDAMSFWGGLNTIGNLEKCMLRLEQYGQLQKMQANLLAGKPILTPTNP